MLGRRILVIGAHPDDEILGCGATIAKLRKRGAEVRVILIGEGSTCRFDAADVESPAARQAIAEREASARAAMAKVGVDDIVFLNLPCGRFDTVPLIDIGKRLEAEIARFGPDTVFTHSDVDANNDHRIAFQATLQATRPGALNAVSTVLCYEVLSSTEWRFTESFAPNYFVSIVDELDVKLEAMLLYSSEMKPFPFPRSVEAMRALAMLRGAQAGVPAAEAFRLIRKVE